VVALRGVHNISQIVLITKLYLNWQTIWNSETFESQPQLSLIAVENYIQEQKYENAIEKAHGQNHRVKFKWNKSWNKVWNQVLSEVKISRNFRLKAVSVDVKREVLLKGF